MLESQPASQPNTCASYLAMSVALATALSSVLLRTRQHPANRSLWLDEAVLPLNIVSRRFDWSTRRLEYIHTAPPGLISVRKTTLEMLGNREYCLRILPSVSVISASFRLCRAAD